MISARKLIKLARKWQKLTFINRKRVTWPMTTTSDEAQSSCSTSTVVEKGHFVVYSSDQRRFVLPLEYLKRDIVRELFTLAEEEFGITSSGPLTLPCDAVFMEYVISLIKRHLTKEVEERLATTGKENTKMISARKLIKLAEKWQRLAVINRRRITLPKTDSNVDTSSCNSSTMAEKGHFVVYSADQRRFVLPLEYLKKSIVRELFILAEEEFGTTSSGPLTLPCDADFMEYMISLIRRPLNRDVEETLLMSIASSRCSSSLYLLMIMLFNFLHFLPNMPTQTTWLCIP